MELGRELAESWAGCLFCILVHIGHTECGVMQWGNMLQGLPPSLASSVTAAPIFHPKYACAVSVSVPHGLFLSARPLQMLFPLPYTLCINIIFILRFPVKCCFLQRAFSDPQAQVWCPCMSFIIVLIPPSWYCRSVPCTSQEVFLRDVG